MEWNLESAVFCFVCLRVVYIGAWFATVGEIDDCKLEASDAWTGGAWERKYSGANIGARMWLMGSKGGTLGL